MQPKILDAFLVSHYVLHNQSELYSQNCFNFIKEGASILRSSLTAMTSEGNSRSKMFRRLSPSPSSEVYVTSRADVAFTPPSTLSGTCTSCGKRHNSH
jgi:hypothetical protein